MGRCSRDARLLFILLWTLADDYGRARGHSRALASLLFPFDNDAPSLIDGWLEELEREHCIYLYEIENTTYLQIENWLKHQRIDHPSKPLFPDGSRGLARPSRGLAPSRARADQGPRTKEGTKDRIKEDKDLSLDRVTASQEICDASDAKSNGSLNGHDRRERATRLPTDWQPTTSHIAFADNLGLDGLAIAEKFRDYWIAVAGAKGRKTDWDATWRNWVRREHEQPRRGTPHPFGPATGIAAGFAEALARERNSHRDGDCPPDVPLLGRK